MNTETWKYVAIGHTHEYLSGPTKEVNDLFYKAIDANKEIEDMQYDTRLIGFRTTKRCHEDTNIKSIQPIYYSTNEKVCKRELLMINDEMKEEIGYYGLDCNDKSFIEAHVAT